VDLAVDPVNMPAIAQVSAKGYRVVFILQLFLSSSYVYDIVQAQQILKNISYLRSKFLFAVCSALPLFLAELVVEFWIPNHSVPFRLAWRWQHLWALFSRVWRL
jgi:hypothetical protein